MANIIIEVAFSEEDLDLFLRANGHVGIANKTETVKELFLQFAEKQMTQRLQNDAIETARNMVQPVLLSNLSKGISK